ncbi:Glycoside hydrolase family 9 [Arabidopsis thaliana x Arabidopsis arenosa]|uniref:Endoglucanase n=2 Tax=Arabidopsis TaxID=3701 RepID=A0A178VAK3_ARATH|nr:Glycoside hydrolase family 9 [Arabidopsis thaliana x Arabidopsis arenosa]OAP03390.1 hypothetical protein AXX17_AT3G36920 [Arabidopsis thaliana]OAP05600.1 hypothetical protein AXX17_AT3G36930 [Arabidopsis thaliana]
MGKLLVVMLLGMFLASESVEALDYGEALNKSILFFEGQRSGKLPTNQRVKWRAESGMSDGASANVNLIGGYYDAGDNVKFVWPMSFTTTLLSWAALEYQNEITSVKQIGYLRSTIKWGTNFILRAHTSPNMLYTQIIVVGKDQKIWTHLELFYSISSSSPGSEVAGEAAAALAAASLVFKPVDSIFSSTLLNHAKSLFEFADKYRGSYQASCPFYCSHSGYQEFYNGTNDLEKFKTDVESFVCALMPGSSSQQIKPTPGGILFIRDNSNLQYVTTATTILLHYSNTLTKAGVGSIQCGSTQFTVSQIRNFAKSQVDYILGNNPLKMSYMVGFGTKYPTQPHHRGSSLPSIQSKPEKIDCNGGFSYYSSDTPNPNVHIGAIVGGPNSSDQYSDKRTDYSHAEPTTYINAAFIGPVAAMISSSQQTYI